MLANSDISPPQLDFAILVGVVDPIENTSIANEVARLASRRGPERGWARLPPDFVAARIAAAAVPVLTDDYAPVDRLMAHLLLSAEASGR